MPTVACLEGGTMHRRVSVLGFLALVVAVMLLVGCAKTEVTKEPIPFQTTEQADQSMWKGETKTVTAGQNGEKQATWRVTGSGDNEKRERVSEKVMRQPVSEVRAVGARDMATGRAITYSRDGSPRYTMVVTDVRRNTALGADTLVVTAHFKNLQTDSHAQIDDQLVLWLKGKELGGWGHLPGQRGLTRSVTLQGAEEGDCVFEFQLRPGSTLRADAASVDDFSLGVGDPSGLGETKRDVYPLNNMWIGPIESGGPASTGSASGGSNLAEPTITTTTGSFTLRLAVRDGLASQVKAQIDGLNAYEGTLRSGDSREWLVTDTAVLTVGKPSAVVVTRDGKPVTLPNGDNASVTLTASR